MNSSVDLTQESIFSNNWRRNQQLYEEDKKVSLPHRTLPWEKTDDELASLINVTKFNYKKWNVLNNITIDDGTTWTSLDNQSRSERIVESIIDDYISIRERTTDDNVNVVREISFSSTNLTTGSDAIIVDNERTTRISYNRNNNSSYSLYYTWLDTNGYSSSGHFYQKDKSARYTEDPDELWFIGHADEIRKKREEFQVSLEYQRLQKKDRMKRCKRTEMSDYPLRDHYVDFMDRPITPYTRWNNDRHEIHSNYQNPRERRTLAFWDRELIKSTRRAYTDLCDIHYPDRFNEIKEWYDEYEEFDIPRAYVKIGNERVLLPKDVVKYKGFDFGTKHRAFPWMPNGRKAQPYDKIFEDMNDDWAIDLLPLMKELPVSL